MSIKISDLNPFLDDEIGNDDLLEVSVDTGGGYVSRKIEGSKVVKNLGNKDLEQTDATREYKLSNAGEINFVDSTGDIIFSISENGVAVNRDTVSFTAYYVDSNTQITSGNWYGQVAYVDFKPQAPSTGNAYGTYSEVVYNSAHPTTGQVSGIQCIGKQKDNVGQVKQITGTRGIAVSESTESVTSPTQSLYGGRFQGRMVGTGDTGHIIGAKLETPQLNGTSTGIYGLYIAKQTPTGGGAFAQRSGLHFEGTGDCISWSGNDGSAVNSCITSDTAGEIAVEGDALEIRSTDLKTDNGTGISLQTLSFGNSSGDVDTLEIDRGLIIGVTLKP